MNRTQQQQIQELKREGLLIVRAYRDDGEAYRLQAHQWHHAYSYTRFDYRLEESGALIEQYRSVQVNYPPTNDYHRNRVGSCGYPNGAPLPKAMRLCQKFTTRKIFCQFSKL